MWCCTGLVYGVHSARMMASWLVPCVCLICPNTQLRVSTYGLLPHVALLRGVPWQSSGMQLCAGTSGVFCVGSRMGKG